MPIGPSRRTVARRLESVTDFSDPSPTLEQYLTPAEIAAHIAHLASVQGDLTDHLVLDLGTGTGMLALAAGQYVPRDVIGIDVDRKALEAAVANESRLTSSPASSRHHWLCADVTQLPMTRATLESGNERVTVVSNPPFGAQRGNRHADKPFLLAASRLADVSYTIHNAGSQSFVESLATDHGGTVTHAFAATFPIHHQFAFHEDDARTLEAEVFRIEWRRSGGETVGST